MRRPKTCCSVYPKDEQIGLTPELVKVLRDFVLQGSKGKVGSLGVLGKANVASNETTVFGKDRMSPHFNLL